MARKNKWLKNNWRNVLFLLIVLGGVGYFIFIIKDIDIKAFFEGIIQTQFLINTTQFDKTPTPGTSCAIATSDETPCIGDFVTSTIRDGENARCTIAFKYNDGEWVGYDTIDLGSDGITTITDSPNYAGEYTWAVVCISPDGTWCRTNDLLINVKDCDDCYDSDGGINVNTPGHVEVDGISYYDKCLEIGSAVTEYFCEDGEVKSEDWMCDYGEVCVETRSGGHCEKIPTSWEVGDVVSVGDASGDMQGEISFPINLGDFTSGGDCYAGIKIVTDWGYITPNECNGIVGPQAVEWTFYDSNGLRWSRVDNSPHADYAEICPTNFDGQTQWKIEMKQLHPYPECLIGYDLNYKVFICECE